MDGVESWSSWKFLSWEFKVHPPKATPPRNQALLRDYQPLVSLDKALLGAYFLEGWHWGGYLKFPWFYVQVDTFLRCLIPVVHPNKVPKHGDGNRSRKLWPFCWLQRQFWLMVKQGGWLRRRLDEIDLFIGSSDDCVLILTAEDLRKNMRTVPSWKMGPPPGIPTIIIYIYIHTH